MNNKNIISGKIKEIKTESSSFMLAPSVFLRRIFSLTTNKDFANSIHWPIEKPEDYITRTQDIFLDTKLNDMIAIRTYEGKGELTLSDKTYLLEPGSLIFFKHHQPRKHKTIDDLWKFNWFEFHVSNIYAPIEEIIKVPLSPKELKITDNIIKLQEKSPNDFSIQGEFSFLLTIWISYLNRQFFYSETIKSCAGYISSNLDKDLNVENLAKRYNFSSRYFRKLFIDQFGTSPRKYIENCKMDKIASLLTTTKLSLSEIAETTGINSAYYLSTRFKKYFGVSPNTYRRNYKLSSKNK